jgi:hypothetical protein
MKLESRLWVLWDVASLLTVLRCVYEDSYMYGLWSSAVEVHACGPFTAVGTVLRCGLCGLFDTRAYTAVN